MRFSEFLHRLIGRENVLKISPTPLKAVNMTYNLLSAFKIMLNESDWMDEESKIIALEKVD